MPLLSSASDSMSRRRFLRRSFAFSALASLGQLGAMADAVVTPLGATELLVLGDWGYEDPTAQAQVATGLRAYAKQHSMHPEALLMLGDNWYGALEGGMWSSRWRTNFEEMYPVADFPCPAYAVLGNHDYQRFPGSKVDAELEYSRSGRYGGSPTRWTIPSRWYRFALPAKDPLLTVIALDSNMPHGDGKNSGRDFTLTLQQQAEQLAWLEAELKRPRTTPYLAVIAHHPVYSDGPHGDHPVLIRDWDPLFRKYGVDLYMAGHDHDLQHLEFENHPTSFFLSGGGGADLYTLKIEPSKRGPYAGKVYGFSHISITPQTMTLRHLDPGGKLMHAFTRTPDGRIAIVS